MSQDLAVIAALVVLAALDGMFSGFRAAAGRSGLIHRRRSDVVSSARGLALVAVLLAPVAAGVLADSATRAGAWPAHLAAGRAMLWVYAPYGALVLLALSAHVLLDWRRQFVASALVLGPFTLGRPAVALGGAASGAWLSGDARVAVLGLAAGGAVLAVEPLAGRGWYAVRHPSEALR